MDNRPKEIFTQIDEEIVDKAHASAVKAGTGPYVMARQRMLFKDMEALLKSGIASGKPEVGAKWKTALQKAIDAMQKGFNSITGAQRHLPEEMRKVEEAIVDDEGKFVQAVGHLLELGAKVDVTIKMAVALDEKSDDLIDSWEDLEGDFKDAEGKMANAQKDMDDMLQQAITEVAANNKSAMENADDVAEYLQNAPDEVNPTSLLGEYAAYVKWLLSLRKTNAYQMKLKQLLWEREAMLKRQIAKRGVGVVMFSEVRDSVKKFLDEVNVEASAEAVSEVKEMIKKAQDGCETPAQKTDMAAFLKELLEHVNDAHESMVSAHDRFVARNSDIFFGAVSNKTMKVLLNGERWKKSFHNARISQLNSALRKLYDFQYLDVPLRSYDGEMKSAVKDYLRRTVGDLYEDIERESAALGKLEVKLEDLIDDLERLEREVD